MPHTAKNTIRNPIRDACAQAYCACVHHRYQPQGPNISNRRDILNLSWAISTCCRRWRPSRHHQAHRSWHGHSRRLSPSAYSWCELEARWSGSSTRSGHSWHWWLQLPVLYHAMSLAVWQGIRQCLMKCESSCNTLDITAASAQHLRNHVISRLHSTPPTSQPLLATPQKSQPQTPPADVTTQRLEQFSYSPLSWNMCKLQNQICPEITQHWCSSPALLRSEVNVHISSRSPSDRQHW